MKKHRTSFSASVPVFLLGAALAHAQAPPSATTLLDQAKTRAAASQRAIFAIFQASW
jgi:hypothetical protein